MLADGALVARKDARIIRCPSRAVEFWSERPISERIVGKPVTIQKRACRHQLQQRRLHGNWDLVGGAGQLTMPWLRRNSASPSFRRSSKLLDNLSIAAFCRRR